MKDGMNDFMARWVLTASILCLLPDGRRSYLAWSKWVGSDIIFFGSHVIQFLKTAIRCRASNNLAGDGM